MKIPSNEFSYPPVGFRGKKLRFWALLFVAVALATLALAFYQIARRQHWFDRYITFYSYLDHSQGIQIGDPVYLMGFRIGYVYKIDVGSSEPGHERDLVLIYKVQKAYHYYINEDSELYLQRFLPGTAKLELVQGKVDSATGAPLPMHPTDQPIKVVLGTTLGGVADKFASVLDKIQDPKGSIGKLLSEDDVHDQLVSLLDSMSGTLDASTSLIGHLDRDLTGEQGELKRTLRRISDALETARTFMEGLKGHWLFRSAFKKKAAGEEDAKPATKGSFSAKPIAAESADPAPAQPKKSAEDSRRPLAKHPGKGGR